MAGSFAPAGGQLWVVLLQRAYVARNLYQRGLAFEPFYALFQEGRVSAVRFNEHGRPSRSRRGRFTPGPIFETTTNALALEQPCHPETVCPYMTMQRARAPCAVKVNPVAIGDYTQAVEIEMSVAALKRVESPCDTIKAKQERPLALRQLEVVSEGLITKPWLDRQHVRMNNSVRALLPDKAVNKSHQLSIIECSDEDAADLSGRDQVCERNNILGSPHFPLKLFDGA